MKEITQVYRQHQRNGFVKVLKTNEFSMRNGKLFITHNSDCDDA